MTSTEVQVGTVMYYLVPYYVGRLDDGQTYVVKIKVCNSSTTAIYKP